MTKTTTPQQLAAGFGLLANPTRLAILQRLTDSPRNVSATGKAMGLKQPLTSYHLGLLRMGRLIVGVRRGKSMMYQVHAAGMKELADALAPLMPRR